MKRAFIFPGQGSQFVGMGREVYDAFPEAREVFEEVDETLKQNLSKLIFNGPIEDLTLTENTQPALMVTSMALFRVLEGQGSKAISDMADYVAGHSLGEYSALAAAKSLSLADTARLLRIRGSAMQQAVPAGQGGMAAIIGVELDIAEKIASEAADDDVCQVANDNSDGQVVISGDIAAIERGEEIAKKHGAKKYVKLNVSAPFHCELMQPAAEAMREALGEVEIHPPAVPLIANVTASETTSPDEIRKLLVKQVTGRVRWRESILYLVEKEVEETVEIGAGKVLSALSRRITRDIKPVSIQAPHDIEEFIAKLP